MILRIRYLVLVALLALGIYAGGQLLPLASGDPVSLTAAPTPSRALTMQTAVPTPTRAAITPQPTPTALQPTPVPDLAPTCARIDALDEAERTLALSQLAWEPDYAGAVVLPSCNLAGENTPRAVVLHYTRGSLIGTVSRFQSPNEASAHYVVDRDGTVYQMIPERYSAYHASCRGERSYCQAACPICEDEQGHFLEPYSQSIGIEIVNWGPVGDPAAFTEYPLYEDYNQAYGYRYWEDYSPEQVAAVKALVEDICARWNIPLDPAHVFGHARVNKKADPGPALNLFWDRYGEPPREAIWPQP